MSDADRIALSFKEETAFGVSPEAKKAQGTLTLDTQPGDTETITVDGKVYTWLTALLDVDGNILIGGSLAAAKQNLIDAIELTGTPGTQYAASMTKHPTVRVRTPGTENIEDGGPAFNVLHELTFEARTPGTAGNALATTETMGAGTNIFDAATLGTTQAGTDVAYQALRLTSESFKQVTAHVESQELEDDRQVSEVPRVNVHAEGDLAVELSYGAYDEIGFRAGLQSAGWSTPETETEVVYSMDASDNSINDSAAQFVVDGFLAKQWIRVAGFANQTSTYFKVVSVVAAKMVLSHGIVVTESAGTSVTIVQAGQVMNGVAKADFEIDKKYTDLVEEYAYYNGMSPSAISFEFVIQAIVTGVISFMGKREISNNSPRSSSVTSAPTKNVLNNVDDILALFEDGGVYASTNFSFALNNNLRQRPLLGVLGPISYGSGKAAVTGALETYFTSRVILQKYLNDVETNLALVVRTGEGDAYIFEFPRAKLTDGSRNATGTNSDVMAPLTFQAYKHRTEGITMRIARFPV